MTKLERWYLIVVVGVLVGVPSSRGQSDPVDNCRPKGDETILCEDREDICFDYGLSVIYDVDGYCPNGKVPYINPDYICNCDVICIDEIAEGEDCEITYPSEYPTALCGNGLDCLRENTGYVCKRNDQKPCVKRIIDYESASKNGTLSPGLLYPTCNNIGQYAAVQCSTSTTCYCSDTDGNRLFGEAVYTERDGMDCQCSLHWLRNEQLGLTEGMRCLANGNLDPLQCNDEFCFCYNSTTGAISAGPFHPSQMSLLSCYDPSYHTVNYTNICTTVAQLYALQVSEDTDTITLGSECVLTPSRWAVSVLTSARWAWRSKLCVWADSLKPNCSLDGYYAAVQAREGGLSYCSDPLGNMIEDFEFATAVASHVTCNCARRRYLLKQAGLIAYLPTCCTNGNFEPIQTRGLYSYCVDLNGNQVDEAVSFIEADNLNCTIKQCDF
ncbi:Thyroglobulin type-1 [Trinorchestia longiramus]|nr:Thyroglobulin type-1 [Trinorchestia longiramus]